MDRKKLRTLFLHEARTYLKQCTEGLLALERNPDDSYQIEEIFRRMHSLKGMSALAGYTLFSDLAHAAEDLFERIRIGRLGVNQDVVSTILQTVDCMSLCCNRIESNQDLTNNDVVAAMTALTNALHGRANSTVANGLEKADDEDDLMAAVGEDLDFVQGNITGQPEHELSIKTDLIDYFFEAIAEIKILNGQLLLHAGRDRPDFLRLILEQNRFIRQLQDHLLTIRMSPLRRITERIPRLVRDYAMKLGKTIDLEIEIGHLECDRLILERLRSPLVHLVNNCVDHGIETPTERKKAGKPITGRIRITARPMREGFVLMVEDDGRGIDLSLIRDRAERAGIEVPEEKLRTGEWIVHVLCHPGFSTKETISHLSGRGVGLDAVKNIVEALGGRLHLYSQMGKGARCELVIPTLISTLRLLPIGLNGTMYAVPLTDIVRTFDDNPTRRSGEHCWRTGEIELPLVDLAERLGVKSKENRKAGKVLIVDAPQRRVALLVSELFAPQEGLFRPLPLPLSQSPCLAGSAMLPSGRPVLILNIAQIL